jgi:hypothetical protein
MDQRLNLIEGQVLIFFFAVRLRQFAQALLEAFYIRPGNAPKGGLHVPLSASAEPRDGRLSIATARPIQGRHMSPIDRQVPRITHHTEYRAFHRFITGHSLSLYFYT